MKRVFFIITILSNMLCSAYLTVSPNGGIPIGVDGTIQLDALSANFTNLEVSSSNKFIEIPIYVRSDTLEAVSLTINNILPLNQNGETIAFSLSFKGTNISTGVAFSLLNSGEGGRDGNTVVGKIKITIPSVSTTQIEGSSYNVNMNMELSSANHQSVATEIFSIGATVPLVAMAGFSSTSSFKNSQYFVGDTINYNTFSFHQKNIIEKDLFVKSNSTQDFTISFNSSQLTSQVDSSYKINMAYYFKGVQFTNNQKFTALTGTNEGVSSLGKIKFETQTITGSLIAGTYRASVGVTIRLE
jgi:hypothetical protein